MRSFCLNVQWFKRRYLKKKNRDDTRKTMTDVLKKPTEFKFFMVFLQQHQFFTLKTVVWSVCLT